MPTMPTKTCSLCGVEKPLAQFNTRPNGTPRSHAPSLYDPWTGIDDEHRRWMEHYRALYRARQERIAARQEKPSC